VTIAPPGAADWTLDKRTYVQRMFDAVAPRYDLLNHLLSANLDRRWRRLAVDRLGWERKPAGRYLDACAGTMDFALELIGRNGFGGRVVATDFALTMLRLGRAKVPACVTTLSADTLALPFADGSFAGATVGFGLRNLVDMDAGLRELRRVLAPGSRLVILEFAMPRSGLVRALYLVYFTRVLPVVGRLVSGHPDGYTYLPASVLEHPAPDSLAERMAGVGFRDPGYQLVTGGIMCIHWGTR
jgi:demethylmenaquinone methyltransferase/2-methoxy-6-polyprenyl-1,4-benzoquinol methylase